MSSLNVLHRSWQLSVSRRSATTAVSVIALGAMLVLSSACSINVKDKDDKNGDTRVDIKSPVGDLHVSEQVDIRDSGLSVYPGARPAPKDDSSNDKSANVNVSFPGFQLKVVAAEFLSDDAPDKVVAYYDKELGKFGKPIQCHGWNTGHTRASGGDDVMSKPVSCSSDETSGESIELKVGTEGNQHLVSVKPNNKGSRFALVYVRIHTGKATTI
jgi:hypothetical protein